MKRVITEEKWYVSINEIETAIQKLQTMLFVNGNGFTVHADSPMARDVEEACKKVFAKED